MLPPKEELAVISDEVVKMLDSKLPNAELYEMGAILISMGTFMVANAIPDLWAHVKPAAILAHQLMNQEEAKSKIIVPETPNIILP